MRKLNWKYLLFLTVLLGLYFVLLYFMPQRFNWFVTLHHKDKNPFGAYVFKSLADNSWISKLNTSNQTLFELKKIEDNNLIIFCEQLKMSSSENETLFDLADAGKTVLIAAHQIDSTLSNALNFTTNELSFSFYLQNMWGEDTLGIRFQHIPFDTSNVYWYPKQLLSQYFESYDPVVTEVIASNTESKPILLKINHGKGSILLSSTPLVFSNFSMLRAHNHDYVSGILSLLRPGTIHWTEYYQLGRMESQTPLRYVLSQPSLKWALYILMLSLLIFMIFEIKRKQRVIPVITPLKNETLDFVKTIARLYYQRKDHKNLAVKKILHFTEYLKYQLHIDLNDDIAEVISTVAAKTASPELDVKNLFDLMGRIGNESSISSKELKILFDRINQILKD